MIELSTNEICGVCDRQLSQLFCESKIFHYSLISFFSICFSRIRKTSMWILMRTQCRNNRNRWSGGVLKSTIWQTTTKSAEIRYKESIWLLMKGASFVIELMCWDRLNAAISRVTRPDYIIVTLVTSKIAVKFTNTVSLVV